MSCGAEERRHLVVCQCSLVERQYVWRGTPRPDGGRWHAEQRSGDKIACGAEFSKKTETQLHNPSVYALQQRRAEMGGLLEPLPPPGTVIPWKSRQGAGPKNPEKPSPS